MASSVSVPVTPAVSWSGWAGAGLGCAGGRCAGEGRRACGAAVRDSVQDTVRRGAGQAVVCAPCRGVVQGQRYGQALAGGQGAVQGDGEVAGGAFVEVACGARYGRRGGVVVADPYRGRGRRADGVTGAVRHGHRDETGGLVGAVGLCGDGDGGRGGAGQGPCYRLRRLRPDNHRRPCGI